MRGHRADAASMGPPLKAAENCFISQIISSISGCFNGAAAKSSGKSPLASARFHQTIAASMGPPLKAAENMQVEQMSIDASMGPPLKAAENIPTPSDTPIERDRFNGAAAKSSGKLLKSRAKILRVIVLQWGRR